MGTILKKALSFFVALTLIFGAASTGPAAILPSAEAASATENELYVRTKFYRCDEATGEWIETGFAKPGEELKLRVFLDASYCVGTGQMIIFLDNDYFNLDYELETVADLEINPFYQEAPYQFTGKFNVRDSSNTEILFMVEDGLITEDFANRHTAVFFTFSGSDEYGCQKMNREEWLAEFNVTVSAIGYSSAAVEIPDKVVCSPENEYGYIDVPVGTEGGSIADTIPMWEEEVSFFFIDYGIDTSVYVDFFNSETMSGDSFISSHPVEVGSVVDVNSLCSETPQREGYKFIGWKYADRVVSHLVVGYETIALFPAWAKNTFNIYFRDSLSGDGMISCEVGETVTVPYPGTVEYEGRFICWENVESGEFYYPGDEIIMPDYDMEFVAHWEPRFTLTLYGSYGFYEEKLCFADEEIYLDAPNEYAPGRYFLHWEDYETGETYEGSYIMPYEDATLYAVYESMTFFVEFDTQGGETIYPIEVSYGENLNDRVSEIAEPTREGYVFMGWSNMPETMPDYSITLVAQWERAEFAAVWEANGEINTTYFKYGDTLAAPEENPEKTGYDFIGWSLQPNGEPVDVESMAMPLNGITFYAVFQPLAMSYKVEVYHMTMSGEYEPSPTFTYNYDSETGKEVSYSPIEYEGFTLNSEQSVLTGIVAADGSLVLKAFYDRNRYEVVINYGDETVSEKYYYGEIIEEPEIPEKEGKVFGGWVDENGNVVTFPMIMPAEVLAFNAVWEAAGPFTYAIETHVMDTDGSYKVITVYHEVRSTGEVSLEPNVSEGFELNESLSVLTGYIDADGSLVLKVVLDRRSYKLTTIIDGKKQTTEYFYNSKTEIPETPEKEGKVFGGWVDENGDAVIFPITMPARDVTVTALWEELPDENIYNLGGETYSFNNYGDSDSRGGHCFGMSVTSSGYYLEELDVSDIGLENADDVNSLGKTKAVEAPICYYQAAQGRYSYQSMVAGGSYYDYKKRVYDIDSDWEEVVNYVKNHEYDNKGVLQIGYRKDGVGGHAINFLRYEEVNGQPRIYAYDNNYPEEEVYFCKNSNGEVVQEPRATFKGAIDCIVLRSVTKYFSIVETFDLSRCIYAKKDSILINPSQVYPIEAGIEAGEYVVFEIPEGIETAEIIPLTDNAEFVYLNKEYSFAEVNENTVGILKLAASGENIGGTDTEFTISEKIENVTINIAPPSTTVISYGDSIILHARVDKLPAGYTVKWTADNKNFSYSQSADGKTCTISPLSSGETVFTVTVYDEEEKAVFEDSHTMTSKAGFFDKLAAFFKKIFGLTRVISQSFDSEK